MAASHTTHKRPRTIVVCLFLLLLLLIAAILLLCARHISWHYTASSFSESSEVVENPYQGFYHLRGYMLSDAYDDLPKQLEEHISWDASYRIVLLEINLKNYREGMLTDEALAMLDQIFSAWSDAGKQMIVRFLYDWDGEAITSEPEGLDTILTHMEQVGEVVNRYTDSIYILQGVFVGDCGEMHDSNYMSDEDMCTLLNKLASVTDDSIYLSVRTPAQWRTVTHLLSLPDSFPAFSGELTSRLGLFNDGMLGSDSDLGTYGELSATDAVTPNQKQKRADELTFQSTLCNYVPNGGEVVIDNSYNDLENAVRDLSAMHVSYLNDAHDDAVLDKWKSSVYTGDPVFDGVSGYIYIAAHLGYRYVLQASSVSFHTWTDETAALSFTLANTGFASCLKAFTTTVTLYSEQDSTVSAYDCDLDIRTLQSGTSATCTVSVPIRTLAEGSYLAYVQMTGPNGEVISLANNAEAGTYGYLLGTLTVKP